MSLVNAEIKMQGNDNAFFTTNAAVVYPANIQIFHTDGRYKFTDGVTALSALPFRGASSGSGVQSVTGPQVDDTDPNNPIVNPLGLIQIVDPNNEFFSDLSSASAYIRTFIDENTFPITDESYNSNVYYFTVPQGTVIDLANYFLGSSSTPVTAYIVDEIGLITEIWGQAFEYNYGKNNVLGNVLFNEFPSSTTSAFRFSNCNVSLGNFDISASIDQFARQSKGKFIFRGNIGSTEGVNFAIDFFATLTSTILATASKYTSNSGAIQGDLQTAISNGANVQFDGINLEKTSNKSNSYTVSSTTTYPSTKALVDGLRDKLGVIAKDIATGPTLTGTTAITAMKSVFIPAHTFTVGDICQIFNRALRSTATGSSTNYLYINTTNSLSGATLIGVQAAAARFYGMERNLFIRSATVSETFDSGTSASGDVPFVSTSAASELNIDWSVGQYIIHAFGAAAVGNSITSNGLIVIKQ